MNRWVVSYDIQKNKRRRKLRKRFEKIGILVQRSVGEAVLDDAQLRDLKRGLSAYVRTDKPESLRCFCVCEQCWNGAVFIGKHVADRHDGELIII